MQSIMSMDSNMRWYYPAMNNVNLRFGEWLADRLFEHDNMTQSEFALRIGVDQSTVSGWVNGESRPRRNTCYKIADFFGVPRAEVVQLAGLKPSARDNLIPASPSAPEGKSTKEPLTERKEPWEYLDQRLRRIELRLGENLPTVEVIGRVPADGVRWAGIGDVYTVEVLREFVADARAPFGLEVTGDCFRSVGIYSGDIVICDQPQGRIPNDKQIVVVRVGDDVTLKRWCVVAAGIELRDGDDQLVYTLSEGDDFEVQGLFLTFIPRAPR